MKVNEYYFILDEGGVWFKCIFDDVVSFKISLSITYPTTRRSIRFIIVIIDSKIMLQRSHLSRIKIMKRSFNNFLQQ